MSETAKYPTASQMRRILPHALISAVRYALGRRTYIVSDTCAWVRTCLPLLEKGTLDVMIRDIEQHGDNFGPYDPKRDFYGDKCDREEWLALLKTLKAARAAEPKTTE